MSGIWRVYANPEGGPSLVEELDLDAMPELKAGLEASKVRLTQHPIGYFHDWHLTTSPIVAIGISGYTVMGFGDGLSQSFGPGDIRLLEDLTGQGHTAAVPGDEPCVVAVINLAT